MAMNGSVRLGAPSAASMLLTALGPKTPAGPAKPLAPLAQPDPTVNPAEIVGLVGGTGLFIAGMQVKGEPGVLMKIIGVVTALVSGYVVSVKKGVIPDVVNAGIPAPKPSSGGSSLGPLKPLTPGGGGAQGGGSGAAAAAIAAPFAPVLQKLLAPSASQQQQNAAQQQRIIQASSPVAAAGAKAVASGGGAAPAGGSSDSGIVTEADLEKSLQTPTKTPLNNPYGIVTESDLEKTTGAPANYNPYGVVTQSDLQTSSGQAPSSVPGIVTSIDEGSSTGAPSIPGIVTPSDFAATEAPAPAAPTEDFVTAEDLAGIANGA